MGRTWLILLTIQFNELYVEWNPETLAAISAALNLPLSESRPGSNSILDNDYYYDAQEDAFFDAKSVRDEDKDEDEDENNANRIISELSESPQSSFTNGMPCGESEIFPKASLLQFRSSLSKAASCSATLGYPSMKTATVDNVDTIPTKNRYVSKPFEISFKLVKLRVNFNKESRHRRLIVAEMDGTSIKYQTMTKGGSRTLITIRNIFFSDCESRKSWTLYREILGLKTDAKSGSGFDDISSLLEMVMICMPRLRHLVHFDHHTEEPELNKCQPSCN